MSEKMNLLIKLTGAPSSVTGVKQINLTLEEGSSYTDILHQIGILYPSLIGLIIGADGYTFLSSNMFLVNGENIIMEGMLSQKPNDGDVLMIISPVTGG